MSAAEQSSPNNSETSPVAENPLFGLLSKMAGLAGVLGYVAEHDGLTGLLTKEAVKYRAEERISAGKAFGIFLMDWDAFKAVNDTLGHEKADQMLGDFGPYMDHRFRREGEVFAHERSIRQPEEDELEPDYLLGRYGGDEFLGLANLSDREIPDGLTPTERMDKAEAYARSVLAGFVEQQDQAVRDLKFNISLGRAIWEPGSSMSVSDLLHTADASMFRDKESHGAPAR